MKNYKLYNIGDRVTITQSHSDDIGKTGTIKEVRHSFCVILIDGENRERNHTYSQFKKLQ